MEQITEDEFLNQLIPDTEYIQAWIYTPEDGAYPLGPMREGIGWVSEENLQKMAQSRPELIIFLQWYRLETT
jgi:hypothetical protein